MSQSQSHVMADGQSASLSWCRAPLGLMTRFLVLYCGLCSSWIALSDERVGLSFVGSLCHVIKNIHISIYTIRYVQYVQGLCQSRLCEADYALSMTTASHLNSRRPDRRQV
jgi:hypothetical protein